MMYSIVYRLGYCEASVSVTLSYYKATINYIAADTLGNPYTGGDGGWRGGSFGATEESVAVGLQRAKWRDSRTEDQCQPAFTSLRSLSAHPLG